MPTITEEKTLEVLELVGEKVSQYIVELSKEHDIDCNFLLISTSKKLDHTNGIKSLISTNLIDELALLLVNNANQCIADRINSLNEGKGGQKH